MEDKAKWTQAIEDLLKIDGRSYVDRIVYETPAKGVEIVTITFRDGSKSMINVAWNSQSAILDEVIREVYGDGAYGKVKNPWW